MGTNGRLSLADLAAGRVTVALAPLLLITGAASMAANEPDIETMLEALDIRAAPALEPE